MAPDGPQTCFHGHFVPADAAPWKRGLTSVVRLKRSESMACDARTYRCVALQVASADARPLGCVDEKQELPIPRLSDHLLKEASAQHGATKSQPLVPIHHPPSTPLQKLQPQPKVVVNPALVREKKRIRIRRCRCRRSAGSGTGTGTSTSSRLKLERQAECGVVVVWDKFLRYLHRAGGLLPSKYAQVPPL